MSNKLTHALVVVFLLMFLSSRTFAQPDAIDNGGQADAIQSSVVDPNVAVLAASEYLPCYYPGNWECFDYEAAYDLEGTPAAYIIIFRDPNSVIKTAERLRISVSEYNRKIKDTEFQVEQLDRLETLDEASRQNIETNLRKEINRAKRASYHSNAFATVVTGATEDSPVVYRCYIGLPGNVVREERSQEWLQTKYPDKKLRIGRLVFLSPVDIRYEVSRSEKPLKKREREGVRLQVQIADQAQLLSFSKDEPELEEVAMERQRKQGRSQARQQQIREMPQEYQQKVEEGELNRKRDNARKWREYQHEHANQSSSPNRKGR